MRPITDPHASRPVSIILVLIAIGLLPACRHAEGPTQTVRVATFNTALSRDSEGALHAAFAKGDDEKAKLVAEVLQRARPDIVLLQEIDYDPTGKAYADFQRNYLDVSQNGAEPIQYEYVYAPPVNTGVLAEVDLDGDGKITRPNDCYGYGLFEGQYGMVVLSRYPIDESNVLSFRSVRWKEFPGNRMPKDYYGADAVENMRLSSKSHAWVSIEIGDESLRLWVSHPTPPVFDGPEDRNGLRNYDEIKMLRHLISRKVPESDSGPNVGSIRTFIDSFIILGDLNADPNDGESIAGAINQLLDYPTVNAEHAPKSQGALEAARLQAGANRTHKTDPATDTADWNDDPQRGSGNLRVDYVLPSVDLNVTGSGVYWPTRDDPHAYLNKASDHKLVWIDIALDEQ